MSEDIAERQGVVLGTVGKEEVAEMGGEGRHAEGEVAQIGEEEAL